jgi:hypothetical protein
VDALDAFLGRLPSGWPYGVEIRNRTFLHPEYFAMLRTHGVTHVFNSWEDMPSVAEQLAMAGSVTNPALIAARFLLRPGRSYAEAVDRFSPYSAVQDEFPEARQSGGQLIRDGMHSPKAGKTLIFVNNRLEGNALQTIQGMLEKAGL